MTEALPKALAILGVALGAVWVLADVAAPAIRYFGGNHELASQASEIGHYALIAAAALIFAGVLLRARTAASREDMKANFQKALERSERNYKLMWATAAVSMALVFLVVLLKPDQDLQDLFIAAYPLAVLAFFYWYMRREGRRKV